MAAAAACSTKSHLGIDWRRNNGSCTQGGQRAPSVIVVRDLAPRGTSAVPTLLYLSSSSPASLLPTRPSCSSQGLSNYCSVPFYR
uniref:Uncharacterized protein n=1 Tax=Oryza sativa subsp. japonica TaxID=39947 RepID=Q6YYA9_ORYSJ|nr:hypothetical protein [Oryza sativa Japonica Group]BAD03809.1 hypothetical protein [Oryza sativa Japonica Group]